MSEDTTTTTTSEDLDDNYDPKNCSSRQVFRKPAPNSGRGGSYNATPTSVNIDSSPADGVIQQHSVVASCRKKDHNSHHHHHHHHHHHG